MSEPLRLLLAPADEQLVLLRAIECHLSRIASALAPDRSGLLTPAQERALQVVLPGLVGNVGEVAHTFTAAEAVRTCGQRLRTAGAPLSAKALGTLFARAAELGAVVDGVMVQRDGQLRGSATWRVVRVAGPSTSRASRNLPPERRGRAVQSRA